LRVQLSPSRRSEQRIESPSLRLSRASATFRQLEALSPFIRTFRRRYRGDEPVSFQPMQHLVQRAGARVKPTTGLLFHVLSDRVSVGRPSAQRDEDVERQIGQRRPWAWVVCHTIR